MKCPFCGFTDNSVIDSRLGKDKNVIRRRRQCDECGRRFTTYERIEEILPLVIKRDGRREQFDRMKILAGLRKAVQKRPVSQNALERLVDRVETHFQESGEKEIKSTDVGEMIMNELHDLDEVAYVRFASVYRSFRDVEEFLREVRQVQDSREKKKQEEAKEAKE